MKNWLLILIWLAAGSAWAAEPAKGSESKSTDKPAAQQEQSKKDVPKKTAAKKQPGTMEKAGNNVKSGWNKFTHDVKQGAKKPACTDAQRSMNQCK